MAGQIIPFPKKCTSTGKSREAWEELQRARDLAESDPFYGRIERIKESLAKINALMRELKGESPNVQD